MLGRKKRLGGGCLRHVEDPGPVCVCVGRHPGCTPGVPQDPHGQAWRMCVPRGSKAQRQRSRRLLLTARRVTGSLHPHTHAMPQVDLGVQAGTPVSPPRPVSAASPLCKCPAALTQAAYIRRPSTGPVHRAAARPGPLGGMTNSDMARYAAGALCMHVRWRAQLGGDAL